MSSEAPAAHSNAEVLASAAFSRQFGCEPESLAFAPGRLNILGEYVDFMGGVVLPAAIPQGTAVAGRRRDDGVVRCYAQFSDELVTFPAANPLDGAAPAGGSVRWDTYVRGVVAELLAAGVAVPGADVAIAGDLPVGAGLSSSAALCVSTALWFSAAAGHVWADRRDVARLTREVEEKHVGVKIGIMDQMASLFGRAGHFIELDCAALSVRHHPASLGAAGRFVLVNSLATHALGDGGHAEDSGYNAIRRDMEVVQAALGAPLCNLHSMLPSPGHPGCGAFADMPPLGSADDLGTPLLPPALAHVYKGSAHPPSVLARGSHVVEEGRRTRAIVAALGRGDAAAAGALLAATHAGLRDALGVSTPELEAICAALTPPHLGGTAAHGAFGCRVMGGGFGGCVLALIAQGPDGDAALAGMQAAYEAKFGRAPPIYPVQCSDGAYTRAVTA